MVEMHKLTDENPYEILDLSINADKKTITKAFTQRNRGSNRDRRLARQAYDTLRKPEERILVDAFTPVFSTADQEEDLTYILTDEDEHSVNWLGYLDIEDILQQSLKATTEASIRHFFSKITPPNEIPELLDAFDGLQESLDEWLK